MKIPGAFFKTAFVLLLFTDGVLADVRLPAIISNHMVLKKGAETPIWGWADPGEEVSVSLAGQTDKAKAGDDRRWMVRLNLQNSAPGPSDMTVEGKNKVVVADVLVGEVWVAGGQSNMKHMLPGTIGGPEEIARSVNPMLRQFKVQKEAAAKPADDCKGSWVVAGPQTSGEFSAVGYYFGKTLQTELQIPVGLINDNEGGTPSESWTSEEAINSMPDLKATSERLRKILEDYPEKKRAFVEGRGAWILENGREDKPPANAAVYADMNVSTEGWIPVKLPGEVIAPGLPRAGAVWLRKEIQISKTGANRSLWLPIDGYDSVYWNGRLLKQTTYQNFPGKGSFGPYTIPAGDIHNGRNILAIRLYEPVGPAQFTGSVRIDTKVLAGEWMAKAEYEFPALETQKIAAAPEPPANPPDSKNVASFLFNGMIHPILPYAITGVIWYQGEANAGRAWQYRETFPLLIKDWRKQWNQGDFPFYFCQLANYMDKKNTPEESRWAELRDAQSQALRLPHTGQAVLIDLGESKDIHFRNKKVVGERLALLALARNGGKSGPASGPVYDSMTIEDGKVILSFTHAEGGLAAKPLPETYDVRSLTKSTAPLLRNSPNSQLEGFAICGADKKWVWADAKIDGNHVIVWSDKVPVPIAVRYAWADNTTCNLSNAAGLPASPFRTDDFPPMTLKAKY